MDPSTHLQMKPQKRIQNFLLNMLDEITKGFKQQNSIIQNLSNKIQKVEKNTNDLLGKISIIQQKINLQKQITNLSSEVSILINKRNTLLREQAKVKRSNRYKLNTNEMPINYSRSRERQQQRFKITEKQKKQAIEEYQKGKIDEVGLGYRFNRCNKTIRRWINKYAE